MIDGRVLTFSDTAAFYDHKRMVVMFMGKDGDKNITCAISHEALEDHFDNSHKNPLKIFIANHERIEHEARRKYLLQKLEPDGSILIRTEDI